MEESKIQEYKWYQASSRQRMSPFPNYLSMEAVCENMMEIFGFSYTALIMHYDGNMQTVFFTTSDRDNMANKALGLAAKDPKIFAKLADEIESLSENFVGEFKKITPNELRHYLPKQLADLFTFFENNYKPIYARYFLIVSADNIMISKLTDLLKQRQLNDEDLQNALTILTTEQRAMVNSREEKAPTQE